MQTSIVTFTKLFAMLLIGKENLVKPNYSSKIEDLKGINPKQ